MENVEDIRLSDCYNITDEGFKYLQNVKNMGLLSCKITGDGFKYLKKIHTIDFTKSKNVTSENLKYLANAYDIQMRDC